MLKFRNISRTRSYSHVHVLKKLDQLLGSWFVKTLVFLGRSEKNLLSRETVCKILIIRPGGIGDAVVLIPVVREIMKHFPEADIAILAERRNILVFDIFKVFKGVTLLCYDDWTFFLRYIGKVLLGIEKRFDLVVDTEQWHLLSAVVSFLMGYGGIRIGFDTNIRGKLFTHPVIFDEAGFEGYNFFKLLSPLGISSEVPIKYCGFLFERGCEKSKSVVIFPGASIYERLWPLERFMEVARWLRERGYRVIVVGGKEDRERGDYISRWIPGVENRAGRTSIIETAKIIASSDVVLASDSGVMHLAVAVGTPVVALFGPGIESKWAPRDGVSVVINKRLPCSPCTRFGYTSVCSKDAECIKLIGVEEVKEALARILGIET